MPSAPIMTPITRKAPKIFAPIEFLLNSRFITCAEASPSAGPDKGVPEPDQNALRGVYACLTNGPNGVKKPIEKAISL